MSSEAPRQGPAEPTVSDPPRPPRRSWLAALWLQRCPRCREGKIFKGRFAMNEPCPVCGMPFEREPGYFLGAMYFSYGLAVLVILPLFFLFQWLLPHWPDLALAAMATLGWVPLTPLAFRYSRVLWIYFDRHTAPSEASSPRDWSRRSRQGNEGIQE